jgi:hypothetical protein
MRRSLVLWFLPGFLLAGDGAALDRAREDLRITSAAEQRVSAEYESRRAAGSLTAAQQAEYEAYLEEIRGIVLRHRMEVVRLSGAPPPGGAGGYDARRASAVSLPQTDAEAISAMEAELEAALGDFDEMLLREQQALVDRARDAGGSAGGGGDRGDVTGSGERSGHEGAGGNGARDGPMPGQEQASATVPAGRAGTGPRGEGRSPTGTREQVAGAAGAGRRGGASGRRGSLPAEVPGGQDDDVVARQLREAAEKETDPELKEKLWEEYRKFKQASR